MPQICKTAGWGGAKIPVLSLREIPEVRSCLNAYSALIDLTSVMPAPASIRAGELCRPSCLIGARIEHSSDQGHAHEIGQARSLHFDHEVRPVVLDRSSADLEVIRNLLVGAPGHQALQHIALAVRQRRDPALDAG